MVFTSKSGPAAKKFRLAQGISQQEFWSRINVTQSGGSRYESGREMPDTVAMALTIAHGTDKEAALTIADLQMPKQRAGTAKALKRLAPR